MIFFKEFFYGKYIKIIFFFIFLKIIFDISTLKRSKKHKKKLILIKKILDFRFFDGKCIKIIFFIFLKIIFNINISKQFKKI
jgi:hypothetical protein